MASSEIDTWTNNTSIILGAISGALLTLIYWLFAVIFEGRTPNTSVIVTEIIMLVAFMWVMRSHFTDNKSIGFGWPWVLMFLALLVLAGFLPLYFGV
jgi:hypothetical protein